MHHPTPPLTTIAHHSYDGGCEEKKCEEKEESVYDAAQAYWCDPKFEVDDVKGGICLTLYLPDLIDVKLNIKVTLGEGC